MSNTKWEEIPASDLRRQFIAERPRDVDGVFNASSLYYREKLIRKLCGLFDLSGAPENWDLNYFWYTLFSWGYLAVVDTAAGVLPLQCGFSGLNWYGHPTKIIIANPVLGNIEKTIDEDGVLINLQYNYHSVQALIQRYATMLAMCDSSLAVGLMNSKVAFIAMASNKQQANTMKRMYDEISAGNPAVFVNQDVANPANFYFNRVKENFIGEQILSVKRSIMNEFLTEVGINNANTDKRERLNSEEVNANNEEIGLNVQDWLDNLKTGIKKVNKMFDLNVSVKRRAWEEYETEEVTEDELTESD